MFCDWLNTAHYQVTVYVEQHMIYAPWTGGGFENYWDLILLILNAESFPWPPELKMQILSLSKENDWKVP